MLGWALTFFVIAILGFGGITSGATAIAQILFFMFIVLFVLSSRGLGAPGTNDDQPVNGANRGIGFCSLRIVRPAACAR